MDHTRQRLTRMAANIRPLDRGEHGAVLVEFALVALLLALLLAATIEFGRMLFYAQALQDAARVFARELSVTPLPANVSFDAALAYVDPALGVSPVQTRIYDQTRLVIDVTGWTDADFDDYIHSPDVPLVNRALLPLMIVEQVNGARLWRYPGALLNDPASPTGLTVGIPRVDARDPDTGAETITWVPIVEEIGGGHFGTPGASCVSPPCGVVAIRLNYPYQAGALSAHVPSVDGPAGTTLGNPISADDEGVVELNPDARPGDLLESPNEFPDYPIYSGPYGLGRQLAYGGQTVRPFRKLLSAQAIYRREVIGEGP